MESTKTLRAYLAVLIAVVTVLIILVPFVLVIHQSYTAGVRLELEKERSYLSSVTAVSRQYILEFMQRLTERAGNAGETFSVIGLDPDAAERYFQHVDSSTDTDAWLIFSGDGALFYGDTANGALFSDTARRAQTSGCSAISDYIDCADKVRRIGVAAPFTGPDGGVWAVVFLYGQSALDQMLADTQAEGAGIVSIVNEKADILASSRTDSPWAGQARMTPDGGDLTKDAPFTLKGANDGKAYRAFASTLGINDWLVVYTVPEELFGSALKGEVPRIYLFGGLTVLCLMLAGGLSAHRSVLGENRLELFKKKFMIATSQSARAALNTTGGPTGSPLSANPSTFGCRGPLCR